MRLVSHVVMAVACSVALAACGGKKETAPPAEVAGATAPAPDAAAPTPDAAAPAPDAAAPAPDAAAPAPDAAAPAPDAAAPAADAAAPVADVVAVDTAPAPVANPTGTLKIQVLSATLKDKAVPGAVVTFQKEGMSSVQGSTSDDGRVAVPHAFPADDASVKLIIKKDGFSPLVVTCPCDGFTYAISEKIPDLDAFRVVLSWGVSPPDLDLHVAYPNNHVSFRQKDGADADLDVDDTDGLGPETITIRKRHVGEKYVFAVHDYTHSGQHGLDNLSKSSAKAFVYVGQSLLRTYYIPKDAVGELWVLFAVDQNGAMLDINNVVDVSEAEAIGPYLGQLVKRTDMGFPKRVTRDETALATQLVERARAAVTAGKHEDAVDLLQSAVQADPNLSAIYPLLADTFTKLGRAAEAEWAKSKGKEAVEKTDAAIGFRVPSAVTSVTQSSVLEPWKHYTFEGENLDDDNLWTSWQPKRKAAGGVGEWVKYEFPEKRTLTGFEFSNGFRRLDELGDLYEMNNRIKEAVIQFDDGTEFAVTFEDVAGEKTLALPAPKSTKSVKLVVKSIYKGSRWNDLAVSEFHALEKPPE